MSHTLQHTKGHHYTTYPTNAHTTMKLCEIISHMTHSPLILTHPLPTLTHPSPILTHPSLTLTRPSSIFTHPSLKPHSSLTHLHSSLTHPPPTPHPLVVLFLIDLSVQSVSSNAKQQESTHSRDSVPLQRRKQPRCVLDYGF